MKKIDINRFGKVLSRLILVCHRSIVKLFAGFLIGFFVIAIMFLPFFNRQPMSDADIRIRLWGTSQDLWQATSFHLYVAGVY